MLAGHWAAALYQSSQTPTVSISTLFLLSQLNDLICCVTLYILHWDKAHITSIPPNPVIPHISFDALPYSHSLFTYILAALPAGLYAGIPGVTMVFSHALLDFLVHYPPLLDPCWPFAPCTRIGLGLWRYRTLSFALESALIVAAVYFYISSRYRRGMRGGTGASVAFCAGAVAVTWALPYVPPPATGIDWRTGIAMAVMHCGAAWVGSAIEKRWVKSERGE